MGGKEYALQVVRGNGGQGGRKDLIWRRGPRARLSLLGMERGGGNFEKKMCSQAGGCVNRDSVLSFSVTGAQTLSHL